MKPKKHRAKSWYEFWFRIYSCAWLNSWAGSSSWTTSCPRSNSWTRSSYGPIRKI